MINTYDKITTLLVDDELMVRQILKLIIEEAGCHEDDRTTQ